LDDVLPVFAHKLDETDFRSCRVLRLRKKMRKIFFEVEVNGNSRVRWYIGKVYGSNRGQAHFEALHQLRKAGFCPPSPFTVVDPIAYIDEQCLLLQEKAPGRPLAEILSGHDSIATVALAQTALCLATLHNTVVDGKSRIEKVAADVARYVRELSIVLPHESARINMLMSHALLALLKPSVTLVSSHGDFHSKNVYITDDGRVTLIDLDTFGRQEPAADVAYFLAQSAIIGYHRHGSFAVSLRHRDWFLRCYQSASPPIPNDRLAVHLGITFLQSLHYELCVLHTGNLGIVELWLCNIERFLRGGEVTITDEPVHRSIARAR
jgi:hypothetical protein